MPTLQCVLGRISSPGNIVTGKPVANSSRWIFDVDHEGADAFNVEVHLLDFISGRPRPKGICTPSAIPLNVGAAGARIYFPDPDKISISCEPSAGAPVRFRVTVDALHTLMR